MQHSTCNTQHSTECKYDLEDRLLDYAARIIRLTSALSRSRAGNHLADQLLRSGTSPLSNHGEAQAAESPEDFIHKLSVALKELKESRRWLRLIVKAELVQETQRIEPLLLETEELIRIFAASIRTSRERKGTK
jgi:four helix bundle protein